MTKIKEIFQQRQRTYSFELFPPKTDQGSRNLLKTIAELAALKARLGAGNVNVVSGSCEELPFRDRHFDMIFSEYTLQYVRDKEKALHQMRRVLRDEGVMIILVPNFIERVFAPLAKCQYLVKRVFALSYGVPQDGRRMDAGGTAGKNPVSMSETLGRHFSLKPDGAYRGFAEELFRHTPFLWKRLFERSGFTVKGTFTSRILPLGILDFFGGRAARYLSRKTHRFNVAMSGLPFMRRTGYSLGMVLVKDKGR